MTESASSIRCRAVPGRESESRLSTPCKRSRSVDASGCCRTRQSRALQLLDFRDEQQNRAASGGVFLATRLLPPWPQRRSVSSLSSSKRCASAHKRRTSTLCRATLPQRELPPEGGPGAHERDQSSARDRMKSVRAPGPRRRHRLQVDDVRGARERQSLFAVKLNGVTSRIEAAWPARCPAPRRRTRAGRADWR
jgi:hypothetical protein